MLLVGLQMPGNWLVLSANEELAGRAVENLLGETSPELAKASKNCLKAWVSRVSRERYEELVAERSRGVAQLAGAKGSARKRKALLEILDDEASTNRLARELGRNIKRELEDACRLFEEEELLDLAAGVAAQHHGLTGQAPHLRVLLSWEAHRMEFIEKLAGGPRHLTSGSEPREELGARIASEAMATIWQEEVLSAGKVAEALGAQPSNREKASVLRKRSELLGLPRDRGYLYPKFQIDESRREVYPEVAEVNRLLGAEDDPWGAASWWVSENARLEARPLELVGGEEAKNLIAAAEAVIEEIG